MLKKAGVSKVMILDPRTPQLEGFFDAPIDAIKVISGLIHIHFNQIILITLYTLIIVHARLFFQIQFFGSARPYSGLHNYFSDQENLVYTIIQVCTIIISQI